MNIYKTHSPKFELYTNPCNSFCKNLMASDRLSCIRATPRKWLFMWGRQQTFWNFFYIYHHSSHALSIMPKSVENVLMLCKPKSSSFHIQRMYVRFHDKLKDNKVDINVMSYYKVKHVLMKYCKAYSTL